MKNLITLCLLTIALVGCKKENNESTKLKMTVSNVSSGVYSLSVTSKTQGKHIFSVDYKTENTVYEADGVAPGDELSTTTVSTGPCNIDFSYKGKTVGVVNIIENGTIKGTIHIP